MLASPVHIGAFTIPTLLFSLACSSSVKQGTTPDHGTAGEHNTEESRVASVEATNDSDAGPVVDDGADTTAQFLDELRAIRDAVCVCQNVTCLDEVETKMKAILTSENIASIDTEPAFNEMSKIGEASGECSRRIRESAPSGSSGPNK